MRISRLDGDRWTTPTTIVEGTDFFANWADVPGVGVKGRHLVAHWLAKSGADTYAYEVRLARSEDGGRTFRPAGVLHADKKPAEHGFVSWLRDGNNLRAVWLDGRVTPAGGSMQLRTAALGAGGPASEVELDARVCDCCSTAAVETELGPLVMYRDRSEGEIRDHSIVRWRGGHWTAPQPLGAENWKIEGCPVNGPALAASGRRVAAAWFTAAPAPRVRFATSRDAGTTFGPAIDLDLDAPLGRIGLTLDADGSAIVSWLASGGEGKARLRLRRVLPDGRLGAPLDLANTSSARAAGVPRIARVGGQLLVVWVETDTVQKLRAVSIPTSAIASAISGQKRP